MKKLILAVAAILTVSGCVAGNKGTKLPVGAVPGPVNLKIDEKRIEVRDLSGTGRQTSAEEAPVEEEG